MVFSTRPLNWESSTLTTRPLLHNRIFAMVSVKTGSICLNQSGSFNKARLPPHLIRMLNLHYSNFNNLNLLQSLAMNVSSFFISYHSFFVYEIAFLVDFYQFLFR